MCEFLRFASTRGWFPSELVQQLSEPKYLRRGPVAYDFGEDNQFRLADPADKHGMLDGQSIRAARVIVDIGVQFELEIPKDDPFGSTPARPGPRAGAGVPAPALPDGRRVPCSSRSSATPAGPARLRPTRSASGSGSRRGREAKGRQGSDFDLKACHRAALDLGSLGLDPLRAALARI